jgi:PAS domain S-box-containing protein
MTPSAHPPARADQQLTENLPEPVWVMGPAGQTVHVNAAWRAATGVSLAEARAAGWQAAVHPADRPLVAIWLQRIQAGTEGLTCECRLRGADDHYRWHLIRPLPGATPQTWTGICTDIHPLKQSQGLLSGQTACLELVARRAPLAQTLEAIVTFIEGLSDGVIGSILLLEGTHLRHGAAPHLPAAYARAIDGTPIGPRVGSCGTAAYRGERVVVADIATDPLWADYAAIALIHDLHSCWSQPIFAADGSVLGTFAFYKRQPAAPAAWDFTLIDSAAHLAGIAIARQRDDDERAGLVERLQEAVAARDDFLSVASHELKTPLTSLQLLIDRTRLRLAKRPPGAWLHDDLQAIDRQSRRLKVLDDTLLDVSQLMADHLRLDLGPVDLPDIVHEVLDRLCEQAAQAGSELHSQLPPAIVGHWDASRLDQIVTNLLANALKFGAGRPVTVTLQAEGDHARLTVADAGIGIAAADQTRLFQRFARLVSPRNYGGFGLGLWIVHELVTALGGTITVTSRLGEGATFTVTLPLAGPA